MREKRGPDAGAADAIEEVERRLEGKHRQLLLALEAGGQIAWSYEPGAPTILVQMAGATWLGWSPHELFWSYGRWLELMHPLDRERAREATDAFLAGDVPRLRHEYRLRRKGGGYGWVVDHAVAEARDAAGRPLRVIGTTTDIDERKRAEQALAANAERLRLALAASRIGIWERDLAAGTIAHEGFWGSKAGTSGGVVVHSEESLHERLHPDDRGAVLERIERVLAGELDRISSQLRLRQEGGGYGWVEFVGRVVERDAQGRALRMLGTMVDITERKEAEAQAYRLAYHDPLTSLPNRLMFRGLLRRACARAERDGRPLALMLLDLDQFKQVNDTLGHTAGDALLCEVARRLDATLRKGDLVARLGGDEFAVLAEPAAEPAALALLAERLVAALGEPYALRGQEVRTGASIGVAVLPCGRADPEGLLASADLALYAAKEAGRGTWRFFDPALQEQALRRSRLERDLHRALASRELTLHYQPVLGTRCLAVVELEALLRWRDPAHGVILPGDFLPFAERSRLILPLTDWVIAEATQQAARWRAGGIAEVPVAVNVPAMALEAAGFVERVAERLAAHGLPAGALTVEVTEGAMGDQGKATGALEDLRRLGVQVALDDFGAGYSSMARLGSLPLDRLKLDRSLLAVAERQNGGEEPFLRALVALGTSLGLPVVAEGVETARQLEILRRVGCAQVQGFLLAPPMPAEAVGPWLERWATGGCRCAPEP